MSFSERVELAFKFHSSHKAAKRLYGKDFQSTIAPYVEAIKAGVDKNDIDEMDSTFRLVERTKDAKEIMVIIAACAELLENNL